MKPTWDALGPPWVVLWDEGRPVAILPAMRPGEVADVRGMKPEDVQRIVPNANEMHADYVKARLAEVEARLQAQLAKAEADASRIGAVLR